MANINALGMSKRDWKDNLEITCKGILFLIDFYERTINLPDCNTCKKQLDCEYTSWGERVRRDCPLHEPKESEA